MPTNINGTTGVDQIQDGTVTVNKIANGAVTIPKIGATGTPDATNFLRGDGSWQVINTTPSTAQVLTATAGASVGAVGTYALLIQVAGGAVTTAGGTTAASNLRYADTSGGSSGTPSGTWRIMGIVQISNPASAAATSVWLRIS